MTRPLQILFWALGLVVVVLSLLPAEQLPSISFDWWDKAQHALAFFALGMLGFPAYRAQERRVLLGLLAAGLAIELAQAATGWRYGDWQDWVADAVGVGGAWGVWWVCRRGLARGGGTGASGNRCGA